jgi:hypothetical protein
VDFDVSYVQSDFVPGSDEVFVRGVLLSIDVLAVRQGKILLGQLQEQLLVSVPLAGGTKFWNL